MKDFCYWEDVFVPTENKIVREKMLLVYNDKMEIEQKYNLTKMGLEQIDSYKSLMKAYGNPQNNYDNIRTVLQA